MQFQCSFLEELRELQVFPTYMRVNYLDDCLSNSFTHIVNRCLGPFLTDQAGE
jgi:hypothetical protein